MLDYLEIEEKNQTSINAVLYKTGDLMMLEAVAITMSLWLVRMLTNKTKEIFVNICKVHVGRQTASHTSCCFLTRICLCAAWYEEEKGKM